MSDINAWDVVADNNNAAPPDGWPEGMNYSQVNNSARENMAAIKRWFLDVSGALTATGSANTYAVTLNAGYSSYFNGMLFRCRIPANNTGPATMNVNGIGARNIVRRDGSDLAANMLVAGSTYTFYYNGTNFIALDAVTLVPDGALSSNIPRLNAPNNFNNSGNVFTGSGAGLTSLNASQLTTGTIPNGRFPATLPAASGANLSNLNASQLTTGTVPNGRFPSTLPAVSGANLTNLNASNIASGTLAAARLPSNVSLVDASRSFTARQTFSGALNAAGGGAINITGGSPTIVWSEDDAGTDRKNWAWQAAAGVYRLIIATDATPGTAARIPVQFVRGTGTGELAQIRMDASEIELNVSSLLDINGDADVSGTLALTRSNSGFGDNAMLQLVSGAPNIRFYETDAASGSRAWTMGVNSSTWAIRLNNDTGTGTQATGLWVTRSGTTATQAGFAASAISLNGNTTVTGTLNTTGNATVLRLRTAQGSDASLTSTNHPFQIGDTSAENLIMDVNEIMTRINGAPGPLALNNNGGDVLLSASGYATQVRGALTVAEAVTAGTAATSTSATLVAGQIHNRSSNTTVNNLGAGRWVAVQNTSTSSITLSQGSGVTLELGGTTTTGNRTLGPRGFAFIYFRANNVGTVHGSGVS